MHVASMRIELRIPGVRSLKGKRRVIKSITDRVGRSHPVAIAEDIAVFGGLWAALNHPTLFLAALAVFIVFAIWLLPKIWRGVRAVFRRLSNWLSPQPVTR